MKKFKCCLTISSATIYIQNLMHSLHKLKKKNIVYFLKIKDQPSEKKNFLKISINKNVLGNGQGTVPSYSFIL